MCAFENARGAYFKCVDSDDWVDPDALMSLLDTLRDFCAFRVDVDLVVAGHSSQKMMLESD